MNEKISKQVMPYYISIWSRISELAEAIIRQCESPYGDANLINEWAREISLQCAKITSMRGEQDG